MYLLSPGEVPASVKYYIIDELVLPKGWKRYNIYMAPVGWPGAGERALCLVIALHVQERDGTQRGPRSQNIESSASSGCIGWEERLHAKLTSITHGKISVTLPVQ